MENLARQVASKCGASLDSTRYEMMCLRSRPSDQKKREGARKLIRRGPECDGAEERERAAPSPSHSLEEEGAAVCYKCGGKKTSSVSMQTRGGDEGMTTFVVCLDPACKNRWKMG